MATCVLFTFGIGGIVEGLKNRLTDWITSKVEDALDAEPPVKRRTEVPALEAEGQLFTWANLYAYQAVNGSLTYATRNRYLMTTKVRPA